MLVITTAGPAATAALGKAIAAGLAAGDVICLAGDLGAGKTLLVQGIGEGLGLDDKVTSPTFTLLQIYEGGRLPVYHFDLYRLETAAELYDIGFEEYSRTAGVTIVEWADKFPDQMPDRCLWIELRLGQAGDSRQLTFRPSGSRYEKLCEELKNCAGACC